MNEGDYYDILLNNEYIFAKDAEKQYGEFFIHTREVVGLFVQYVESLHPDATTFIRFFSQVRKHAALTLLSFIRRHSLQGFGDWRQMTEAGVFAVYALHETNESAFYFRDSEGMAHMKENIKDKAHKFLEENFPNENAFFKGAKKKINEYYLHADIVSTVTNADWSPEGMTVDFFDSENEDLKWITQYRLWFLAYTCLKFLQLFEKADRKHLLKLTPSVRAAITSCLATNKILGDKVEVIAKKQNHISEVS